MYNFINAQGITNALRDENSAHSLCHIAFVLGWD